MNKDISRHVVMVSDKVWEDARVKAIREHITLAQFVEEALDNSAHPIEIRSMRKSTLKSIKSKLKSIDSKKGKKID